MIRPDKEVRAMCCRYYILPKGVEWDPIREGAESARLLGRFREVGASL